MGASASAGLAASPPFSTLMASFAESFPASSALIISTDLAWSMAAGTWAAAFPGSRGCSPATTACVLSSDILQVVSTFFSGPQCDMGDAVACNCQFRLEHGLHLLCRRQHSIANRTLSFVFYPRKFFFQLVFIVLPVRISGGSEVYRQLQHGRPCCPLPGPPALSSVCETHMQNFYSFEWPLGEGPVSLDPAFPAAHRLICLNVPVESLWLPRSSIQRDSSLYLHRAGPPCSLAAPSPEVLCKERHEGRPGLHISGHIGRHHSAHQ